MKLFIPLSDLTPDEQGFITTWRQNKGYKQNEPLSFGECVELTIALSYNLHQEWSDGRTFNYILTHPESLLAWDGEEAIDIFFYEFREQYKKRLAQGTLTEPVEEVMNK